MIGRIVAAVWIATLAVAAFGVGCATGEGEGEGGEGEGEGEGEPPRKELGEDCVVDVECASDRCRGGVCDDDACVTDGDCRPNETCVLLACEPIDDFACEPDQSPVASVVADVVGFGEVTLGSTQAATVGVQNFGDCLLTVVAATLDDPAGAFACAACDPADFPVRTTPNRAFELEVTFTPLAEGSAAATLTLEADDAANPSLIVTLEGVGAAP